MSNPQGNPTRQRRFKPLAGIQRKTAEERAASIQAEAIRQTQDQQSLAPHQPQPPAPLDGRRRRTTTATVNTTTGAAAQRDEVRAKGQNPGTVFGSITGQSAASGAADANSSRGRHAARSAVGGVEELIIQGAVEHAETSIFRSRGNEEDAKQKETGESPNRTKAAARSSKSTGKAKKDEVIHISDDATLDGVEGKPVDIEDIERISISTGSEDEDKGKGKGEDGEEKEDDDDDDDDVLVSRRRKVNKRTPRPALGLRPVRAARDAFTTAENFHQPPTTKPQRKGGEKDASKADGGEGDQMELDGEDDKDVAVTARQTVSLVAEDKAVPPPSPSPTKRRRKYKTKEPNSQLETVEERAERQRYTDELRKLGNEWFPQSFRYSANSLEGRETSGARRGDLYLFQFPPLTPMLVDPASRPAYQPGIKVELDNDKNSSTAAQDHPQIKKEKAVDADVKATSSLTHTQQPPPVLLTAAPTTASHALAMNPALSHEPPSTTSSVLPPGQAGRLNIHHSGKVTLEWGCSSTSTTTTNNDRNDNSHGPGLETNGAKTSDASDDAVVFDTTTTNNLEVKWGTETNFLQEVVLLAPNSPVQAQAEQKGDNHVQALDGDDEDKYDKEEDVIMVQSGQAEQNNMSNSNDHKKRVKLDIPATATDSKDGDGNAAAADGKAWSLKQIKSKFVVVPDWARVFE